MPRMDNRDLYHVFELLARGPESAASRFPGFGGTVYLMGWDEWDNIVGMNNSDGAYMLVLNRKHNRSAGSWRLLSRNLAV